MIYDLASVIELEKRENVATEELEVITFCHKICKVFYDQEGSPLYRQIRMLGTGQGSVSQGFLVDALYLIVVKLRQEYNEQEIFNALYYYLSSFQSIFSDDWPVLENVDNIEDQKKHAHNVLKVKKSQLAKTLGLGAILLNFPLVFSRCKFDPDLYERYVSRLKGKIAWSKQSWEEDKSLYFIEGTNKKVLKSLLKK
ncbi:hypothetical protein P9597_30990 [Aneurinibacillus migulanus]|uniref:hypothetical protein n=1 Tax=Aneurinibacillus migulanus TaxID=47500 RepID=UPI002E205D75|nr:hypothetical protein [Aneurinibacillus migulanus]